MFIEPMGGGATGGSDGYNVPPLLEPAGNTGDIYNTIMRLKMSLR